jgi:hypothetical protein
MGLLADIAAEDEVRARLIAALDLFTRRSLLHAPPADAETMAHLGVGASNLDRYIRPWINQTFRDGHGLRRLVQGEVKTSAAFSAVLALCKGS